MIAPEQDRLTRLMDELAHRADGTAPADRLDRVHRRARRTTQVRVVVAATAAAVVVVAAGTLISRSGDVGQRQQPAVQPSVVSSAPTTAPTLASTSPTPTQTTPTPTSGATAPTPSSQTGRTLVPADSRYPAAGACAFVGGTVVTVTMDPDVPSPRCVSLHPGQQLRVVNASALLGSPPVTITVRWADYAPRVLQPGQSTTYTDAAGSYLAVGVHRIVTAPLYGGGGAAQVWLH